MPKLDHIAIVVKDLDKAIGLFRDGLQMALERVEDLPDRGVRVAFLVLGSTHLELIESQRADSEVAAWIDRHGEGLHHVALAVDDLQAALTGAEAAGAQRIQGSERSGAGDTQVAFLHPKTLCSVLVELVEHGKT